MRLAAHLLVAVWLLLSQQVALAHQIWHLGKPDSAPAHTQLCEQHDALATVAGALDCAPFDAPLAATADVLHAAFKPLGGTSPQISPTSRSPPDLS